MRRRYVGLFFVGDTFAVLALYLVTGDWVASTLVHVIAMSSAIAVALWWAATGKGQWRLRHVQR